MIVIRYFLEFNFLEKNLEENLPLSEISNINFSSKITFSLSGQHITQE